MRMRHAARRKHRSARSDTEFLVAAAEDMLAFNHEEEFVLVLDGAPNGVVNRELVVPVDAGMKATLAAIS